MKERLYSVRIDDFELTRVTLGFEEYKDQPARDETKKKIAATYKVPPHYLRLQQVEWKRYRWNEETQRNQPIGEK